MNTASRELWVADTHVDVGAALVYLQRDLLRHGPVDLKPQLTPDNADIPRIFWVGVN